MQFREPLFKQCGFPLATGIGLSEVTVVQHRASLREDQARDFPIPPHAHHAQRQRLFFGERREQTGESGGRIGAGGDLANVGTGPVSGTDGLAQFRRGWRRLEVVERRDHPHPSGPSRPDSAGELGQRAQFDIEVSGEREELSIQCLTSGEAEGVNPAFRRMPDCHDQGDTQLPRRTKQCLRIVTEIIHSELDQIDLPGLYPQSAPQGCRGGHRPYNLRLST